jgi:HEAT repeat protein
MSRFRWFVLVFLSLVLSAPSRAIEPASVDEEPIYQGKTLAEWIDGLKDPEWEVQRAAAQSLGIFGPKKDVISALTTALKNEDAGVVLPAAQTLGKFGLKAKEALPELRAAYKRLSAGPPARAGGKKYSEKYLQLFAEARQAVAEALILIDDHPGPELAPVLIQALKTGDGDRRRDIIIKLGKLGPAAAKTTVPALIAILKETDEVARHSSAGLYSTAVGLGSTSGVSSEKAKEIRLEAIKSLGRIGSAAKPALHALTLAMKLAAPEKNAPVQRIEGWDKPIGSADAKIQVISFTIHTGDKAMLQACAEALGRIRVESKGTAGALRVALRDLDEGVRWAAVCALLESDHDAKQFMPLLLNFLCDKDAALRRVAVEALGKSGADKKQILPAMTAALKDTEEKVRAAAAEALGKVGVEDKEVVQALIAALGDKEIDVFQAVGRTLVKFGPKAKAAIPQLLVFLRDSNPAKRAMSCLVLASIGPAAKEAIAPLEKMSQSDATEYVRLTAYAALARIDSSRLKDTLPHLTAALRSKESDVVEAAGISLVLLGRDARDVLPMLRTLRDQTSDADLKQVIETVIEAIEHPGENPLTDW